MLRKLFKVEKSSTKEFWLSHVIILVTTVIAVYMAAMTGLKTAVSFELIQSDRNSYYLQASLLDEFNDNIDLALKIGKDCSGNELDSNGKRKCLQYFGKNKHSIDNFVWSTMRYSQGTFEIPSQILTGVRQYNRLADRVINLISKAEDGRWHYNYKNQSLILLKESKDAKSRLVPLMQKEIDKLKKRLKENGVDI